MAFLGVAFFTAGFFLVAVAFFAGLDAAGAVVFVMRPDLVLPSTRDTSFSTAGGAAALRGLLALAFGLAAVAFFVVAGLAAAFFVAGVFLVVTVLVFYGHVNLRSSTGADRDNERVRQPFWL